MSQPFIYLDYAAATPVSEQVLKAMQPYYSELFYNPSASYLAAKKVSDALGEARSTVCHWIGAKPTEITFTAGGTEANNLAIHGIMSRFPKANLVLSAVEHDSILEPAKDFHYKVAPVQPDGRINLEELKKLIDDSTALVSVMYANNEIGTVQPIRELSRLIHTVREERKKSGNSLPIYLHTDACQAANYLDLHVERLGVDLMTVNGSKMYGPKQSGILYHSLRLQLNPLIKGGGQERGLRSGTENAANIVGFAKALEQAQSKRQEEVKRLQDLQKNFFKLVEQKIPSVVINGSLKHRLPNNLHITLPGQDNERLIFALDETGILTAAGSACKASNDEPSHVLRAIGLSEENAEASLRLTMGRSTTEKDIVYVAETLSKL